MDSAEELEILIPEREITVAGKTVTVREFSFMEGLRLAVVVSPMVSDMEALFSDSKAEVDVMTLQTLFANHSDALMKLMAVATSLDASVIEGLNDNDGQLLLMTFWAVNKGFFVNRLIMRRAVREANPQEP